MPEATESIRRAFVRYVRRWPLRGERLVVGALFLATSALLAQLVLAVAGVYRTAGTVLTVPALVAVGYVLFRLTLPRHFDSTRDRLVGRAVAKERERFARDLHDLLGHRLSVVAVKSELARRQLATQPDAADEELSDVIDIARRAQSDVRAVAHSYPTTSLQEELASAYAVLEAAGFHCRVEVACGDLPPRIGEALAHVVREGVTNVIRHGTAGGCEVQLVERDGRVALTIANAGGDGGAESGEGGAAESGEDGAAESAGHGIANLRGRVSAIGGSVTAGTNSAGQFRLRVTVPLGR